jgi:hypothetical protein
MSEKFLEFRGILASYADPRKGSPDGKPLPGASWDVGSPAFWDREAWDARLSRWSAEGYNAVVWLGPNEFGAACVGDHILLRHEEFPEARELPPEQSETIIAEMKWLFQQAKELGLRNFLYTLCIWVTPAFARAHEIDQPMPVSETVSKFHNGSYGPYVSPNCGVRNELTRKYTEAAFAEMARLYEDLDGFYAGIGECLPGERTSWFREAIAPGLRRCGRKPLVIAHQWQCTLDAYMTNVVRHDVYDNVWLGYHAYNSEQITDAKPYPGLVEWMETTDLPTVAAIYPANVSQMPFNSPRFAYEITKEMKKHANFRGFLYWEFSPKLSDLFRAALPYYASRTEPYADEPWLTQLEARVGDREGARHFLNAYNISGRIIPEMCALVFGGSDWTKRELRLPYDLLRHPHWATSPVRGQRLIPIGVYTQYAAASPGHRDRNGSEYHLPPYAQEAIWGSEGGSIYDILPNTHMRKVRDMGEACLREAELAMKTVRQPQREAGHIYNFMKAYQLLSKYYERKVAAGVAALIHMYSRQLNDRREAERLADEALQCYLETADFLQGTLDGIMRELRGQSMKEIAINIDLQKLVVLEREERDNLARIFDWDDATPTEAGLSKTATDTLRHA